MTTLIKDLITLPERVGKGDFVLELSRGVQQADETLRNYVVTPQLATCFDDALHFIRGALETNKSRAAYLHGSFGSGKSHFMAVLHLLLQQNPAARSIPELAAIVSSHNAWSDGKRFLLVPYHMIGKASMEQAILGHYAEHVARLHPEAPVPPVFLAEALFEDATGLRAKMGDERFFAALNEGAQGGGDGWGDLGAAWDARRFDAALKAAPANEERLQLVSSIVGKLLPAYAKVAAAGAESYIALDQGLSVISRHAAALGYHGVILFLDELILWLASHAADLSFVSQEGQKLAKLVEAESADRPIPLVSFVARQRDLRQLVGEHVTGADQLRFADVLSHWEGRFHTITLEDRNLPKIAEQRVLKPKSEAARQMFDDAFKETEKVRREILEVLLTDESDLATFRQVYPFSPALIETLVAVSSVLQRERTALKVMLQLLVEQRDTLKLGEIVPVGDLFDVIAEGDEPFSEGMRLHFENAKRLYNSKLLPLLEREHSLRASTIDSRPADDPAVRAFRANDRILKTLLLAALVPEVRSLKALTGPRLAALNHGSIRTPIPGREGAEVLTRLNRWASQVGEIKVSDDPRNPIISIQTSGVDTEAIIENNRRADNDGNRRRKIRDLLFRRLGIDDRGELQLSYEKPWRGTQRDFAIIFGNVRELPDESFRTRGEDRRVIIDFPFDPDGRPVSDDLARLATYRGSKDDARTLVWLPSYLSLEAQRELAMLVILDDLLTGERFDQCASHLSSVDKAAARSLLDNQRSQLHQRALNVLEGAYGVADPIQGTIDRTHELNEHFQSLDHTYVPRPPVGANLKQAFDHLLDQMLESQYPAHPRLEVEVKPAALNRVREEVERAVNAPDGRIAIERGHRDVMRGIATPLELGEMGETHFVLGQKWAQHFDKEAARDEVTTLTVGRLREWMERPAPRGIPKAVQNLIIITFAAQTNRSFFLHGGAVRPDLQKLEDDIELREQRLPASGDWAKAVQRAASIFGINSSQLLNAANASRLNTDLTARAQASQSKCTSLLGRLDRCLPGFVTEPERANRVVTARASASLVDAISSAGATGAIEALAGGTIATSESAMASCITKAGDLASVLESTSWTVFESLRNVSPEKAARAKRVLDELGKALAADEYAVALGPRLKALHDEALAVLVEPQRPTPPAGSSLVTSGQEAGLNATEAKNVFDKLLGQLSEPDRVLELSWRILKRAKP
jgi:hypothetical protein